ncbi:TonB-dependent siderophore receptor [Novosphingobium sp. PhB165]|uniref:TonB-dependent siderophore receptor n=1 Tax=Novosphingobium sp. PhB165 TaxID=2485105 RepID=UPI001FB4D6CD|nr:TonB-dependent siderophore receptor [Novosphingobium sp. PhB165]
MPALAVVPAYAAEPANGDDQAQARRDIIVTGARTNQVNLNESASATGLDLSLRETPQSVTVVDRQRIDDFALTNVNDLLEQTVGVTVQRNETDRTEYTSRGFDITNFQVDGIGLPLLGAVDGDLDTILYERVEIVRGANAIMTGVGNPSATVNYLRKRPTTTFQANVSAYAGSFEMWRLEGDVSGPLNASGTLRARVIGAHEERNSYLDFNKVNRTVVGGFVALDITPDLTATVGYTRQENKADGILWGALPLIYSDGTRIAYPRSASTSAPWTYANVLSESAFGELTYRFGGDWSVRGVFTYNNTDSRAKRLYASGTPDPDTGLGIVGSAGIYPSHNQQYLIDGYASGSVELFGRSHQLAFGMSNGWLRSSEYESYSDAEIDYGDIRQLSSFVPPEPDFPEIVLQGQERNRLTRVYGAIHLNFMDRLKGVAGASAVWLKTTGDSYGSDLARDDHKVSPYAGLLFDLTSNLTLYASYTDIYAPQSQVDIDNRRLDPAKGTSLEAGLKGSWLDNRLSATAAVFKAKQRGLASYLGTFDGEDGPLGLDYYEPLDTTSKGFEVEVSGRVMDHWLLSGGFTHLKIEDDQGLRTQNQIPRDSIKLAATYEVPEWRDLKLGAQFRYQSAISGTDDSAGLPISQKGYAVVDVLAGIKLVDHVQASVNVRNLTNAKYLNSLAWGQAFYAAPRSVIGTIRLDY